MKRYEVRIHEGELPALLTDSLVEAEKYWLANSRKIVGNVGIFDTLAHSIGDWPWIA